MSLPPYEPVSYERVWDDGYAEGARRWTVGGFMEQVAIHAVWAARRLKRADTHIRLRNGQLVIVRPRVRT